jgi:hypothetical protein
VKNLFTNTNCDSVSAGESYPQQGRCQVECSRL